MDLEPAVSGVERLRAERRWVGSSPQAPSGKTCVWVSFLSLDLEGKEEFQVPPGGWERGWEGPTRGASVLKRVRGRVSFSFLASQFLAMGGSQSSWELSQVLNETRRDLLLWNCPGH